MTADELRRLLNAPEIVVVDLVDATLDALRRALFAEHPLLDDDTHAFDDPPVRDRARAILRQAERLQCALTLYRRAVDDVLADTERDDPDGPPF